MFHSRDDRPLGKSLTDGDGVDRPVSSVCGDSSSLSASEVSLMADDSSCSLSLGAPTGNQSVLRIVPM